MTGGTPGQNTALLALILVVVAAGVAWVLIGRVRRAWATGSAEAGSVTSRARAVEIADRLCSVGASAEPVRVRGAARLFQVLKGDDRFQVAARGAGDEYWSFTVRAPERADAGDRALRILDRHGVTATVDRPDPG